MDHTHSVKAGLSAGEREGEAQRKTSVLHPHVVQEITDALHNVIKQLEERGGYDDKNCLKHLSQP